MNKVFIVIILFFNAGFGFAQEIRQPEAPRLPTAPIQQTVPSATENIGYPNFPSFPTIPSFPSNNQTNEPVQEIERYDLNISGAFPNGNTRNNVANTIDNAQYVLYSNRTVVLKLFFRNGSEYIYHLRNPRAIIEISTGVFRETYDTIVQVGREFLLEQYSGELCYDNNTIISFSLIGSNRVIVLLNFLRKNK